VTLGGGPVSSGTAEYIQLALTPQDVPWVVYRVRKGTAQLAWLVPCTEQPVSGWLHPPIQPVAAASGPTCRVGLP